METVVYGRYRNVAEIPNLVEMQTKSYHGFLQPDLAPQARQAGPGGLAAEIFPIYSYDKTLCLEYISYELGRPRYTPEECRKLRMTYGYPFKIRVRLVKPEPVEEEIYLGEIPIMIGGGEFIINGSERVTVSQLHRSPGVDFSVEMHTGEKRLHSCWIIPERGSWIELNVTKKDALAVRIDQSGKFSAATLLRAMDAKYCPPIRSDHPRVSTRSKKVTRKKSDPEAKFAKALNGATPSRRRRRRDRRAVRAQRRGDHRGGGAWRHRGQRPQGGRGPQGPRRLLDPQHAATRTATRATRRRCSRSMAPAPGQPAAAREGARPVSGEVLRRHALPPRQGRPLPPQPQVRPDRPEDRADAAPGRLRQQAIKYILSLRQNAARSTTSITWATGGCAPSRSWRATSSARASSSCAAPRRSG